MGKRRLSHVVETENGDEDVTESEVVGSDDELPVDVKPIGDVIKRSNKGRTERRHYEAVEIDGVRYDLEDAVLVTPEQRGEKPYVAIIKEIKQAKDGSVAVTGQWFYRPEEAEKKGGGSWMALDSRELFYSFHRDEVPAESVMHKCVVHFIPPRKQAPLRTKHPGFVIRHVYDTVAKTLWKLTDKDYEDSKQKEIDLLVQKTKQALGDLPDVEGEEVIFSSDVADDVEKGRRQGRRKAAPSVRITREDAVETADKGDAPLSAKVDTPSSCRTPGSAFPSDTIDLLRLHNALTGQTARDRWLEKIVGTLKFVLDTDDRKTAEAGEVDGSAQRDHDTSQTSADSKAEIVDEDGGQKDKQNMWPEAAISAATALERVAHEFNAPDVHKYNLKLRQLDFNLKKSTVLTRRLLSKDLEPATVFHMSPDELKNGFTAAETEAREPPELETLQMTDARCGICGEREVGVKDIIHVGYGDRYQLECLKCGNSWYDTRDAVSKITTEDQVSASPAVGLAPWATSKFEEVEKDLTSPREPDKEKPVVETHESLSPLQAAKPVDVEGTNASESHYGEVERILNERIAVPVTAPPVTEQSSVDEVAKGGSENEDEVSVSVAPPEAAGDHEGQKNSDNANGATL